MTSDHRPYPEMKDSGVGALGRVPAHWRVRKLGQIGRFSKGNGGSKIDELRTGIPCIRYGDLYTNHTYFIHQSRGCISPDRVKDYTPIGYGDVLFAASGETIEEIGKSAVNLIKDEAYCGGDIILFRPSIEAHPKFMGYATDFRLATDQKARMGRGFTVVHVYSDQLKRLAVPLPPLREQASIVRFLANADRRIRRYIRAKEKLIALLQEQKQVVIHQAVTGQIDVRTGQFYPAYKPSRVECLGDVPAHWELVRLKDVAQVQTGLTLGKDYGGARTISRPYLRVANVQTGHLNLGQVKSIDVPPSEAQRSALLDGDVLMTEGGDIDKLGRGCIWNNEIPGCLHQNHIFAVRCNRNSLVPEFLVGLMASQHGRAYFQLTAKQTTNLASTNSTTLRAFPIPLPPLDDQLSILRAISEKANALDSAVGRAATEIDLLLEYRTRLIADVVTGKLDVREAAVALREEPDDLDAVEADCAGPEGRDDDRPDCDPRTEVPAKQREMTS